MILSNTFDIEAKQTNFTEVAKYEFNKSTGPVVLMEFQEDINRWLAWKTGLKFGHLKYEIKNVSYGHEPLALKSAKKS